MAEGRGGSRWTEEQRKQVRVTICEYATAKRAHYGWLTDFAIALERAVFPVGEPDASQETINGLLDAVERLNGQKDALRRENGQLRELLDLPVGERVAAVAELAREPDDERLVEQVAELMRRQEGEHRGVQWNLPVYRKRARAVVAAVRAAGENPE